MREFPAGKNSRQYSVMKLVTGPCIGLAALGLFVLRPAGVAAGINVEFSSHVNSNDLVTVARQGDVLWFGTRAGGVMEYDTALHQIRTYTRNSHGLPSDSIEDITVGPAGDVWIATFRGLGHRPAGAAPGDAWQVLNADNSFLPENLIMAVAADPVAGVWIGTFDSGVFHQAGETVVNHNASNSPLSDNFVTSIVIDPAGAKWFGLFSDAVDRFDGVNWMNFNFANTGTPPGLCLPSLPPEEMGLISSFVRVLHAEPGGTMWFSNVDDGFCDLNGTTRFDGVAWSTYRNNNSGMTFNNAIDAAAAAGGQTFVVSQNGVNVFENGGFTDFIPPGDGPLEAPQCVAAVGDDVWFGTAFGPAEFADGTLTLHGTRGIADGLINDIAFRSAGGEVEAWVCNRAGVQRLSPSGDWSLFNPANSQLASLDTRAVEIDLDGRLWFGSGVGGGAVQHVIGDFDDPWVSYTPSNSGLISTAISDIAVDPVNGDVWFGDRFSSGLARFDGENWATFLSNGSPFGCNAANGIPGRPVTDIEVDPAGIVWIASGCGLTRYDGATFTTFDADEGLANISVRDLAIEPGGAVWVGTFDGVARFDGATFTNHFAGQGFDVTTVLVDAEGLVWISVQNVGIAAFDGATWTQFGVDDGLVNDRIVSSAQHPDGSLWFGSELGIAIATLVPDIAPGDIDGDGDVDLDDADALVAVLLEVPDEPEHVDRADLNGDGRADGIDLPIFVALLLDE